MADDKDKQDLAEERTEWAEDRTDWAEDRTVLSNERTFSGWMRTGLGSLGLGIAMHAVFAKFEPTWAAKAAATVFVVIALVLFVSAMNKSSKMLKRLEDHSSEPMSGTHLKVIGCLMSVGAISVGVVLWLL